MGWYWLAQERARTCLKMVATLPLALCSSSMSAGAPPGPSAAALGRCTGWGGGIWPRSRAAASCASAAGRRQSGCAPPPAAAPEAEPEGSLPVADAPTALRAEPAAAATAGLGATFSALGLGAVIPFTFLCRGASSSDSSSPKAADGSCRPAGLLPDTARSGGETSRLRFAACCCGSFCCFCFCCCGGGCFPLSFSFSFSFARCSLSLAPAGAAALGAGLCGCTLNFGGSGFSGRMPSGYASEPVSRMQNPR